MPYESETPGSPVRVRQQRPPVAIIGAGPAGLTAAYQLTKSGDPVVVFEADEVVGGLSRTVEREGWRFDIGGHRFFTKVQEVEALWHEILADEDFLMRPRLSRIFYDGKYYDYPLKPLNVLKNLGPVEASRYFASYLAARVRPPEDQTNYEGWLVARFGWRLYRTLFKTYTEKVWGMPVSEMPADWAAQRVKNLDLGKAVWNALLPKRNQKSITSLIEEFQYPKYGPGMMWERCRYLVESRGGVVRTNTPVIALHHDGTCVREITVRCPDGTPETLPAAHVISSMPMADLVRAFDPRPPDEVMAAGEDLRYRDFMTVALVVPQERAFPDNWIYVHSPEVRVGRIQNFGQWSPYMVHGGRTCLGLEYFVFEGDELWNAPDQELIELGKRELAVLGLARPEDVLQGYVVRMPKAYPTYDDTYRENVETVRKWIETTVPNVHPVGRNGMHKYNNQDHAMFTAMLTVENIHGADHDIWSVNVEAEYHEEQIGQLRSREAGTGRLAPVLPRRTADSPAGI